MTADGGLDRGSGCGIVHTRAMCGFWGSVIDAPKGWLRCFAGGVLGEYGALLGESGYMSMLSRLPHAIVGFLQTQEGQIAAGTLLAVLFFLFVRKG